MKAKKNLGQNFLEDKNTINQIVSLLNAKKNDLIIEIGPGKGALTKHLKSKNSQLICIEVDEELNSYLKAYQDDTCSIIYSDVLKVNFKEIIKSHNYQNLFIIGNLPYYITTPIISYITSFNLNIEEMVFMVQKEVADRFCSKAGSRSYGYISLYLQYYYDVTKEIDVPRTYFSPVPKVDSAVIKLKKRASSFSIDEIRYFSFLKDAFKHKRKTLKNNLKEYNWNCISKTLQKYHLNENVRAEEISENIFIDIVNNL